MLNKSKPKLTLKDVRMSWVSFELHRNGRFVKEEQAIISLIAKYEKLYGKTEGYTPLSRLDAETIINEDPSRARQKSPPDVLMKEKLKRLEVESKVMDYKLRKEEFRQRHLELSDTKVQADKTLRRLLDDSNPEFYNLHLYQRMPIPYCILAIQSEHPELSDKQCKMILGSWVRKGY